MNMAIGIVLESVNHDSDMLEPHRSFMLYRRPLSLSLCRFETRSGSREKVGLEMDVIVLWLCCKHSQGQ